MNKAENQKPSHNLTFAENLFIDLIKDEKYKDKKNLSKNMVMFKSKFMLKYVDDFEKQVFWNFLDQMDFRDLEKIIDEAEKTVLVGNQLPTLLTEQQDSKQGAPAVQNYN